MNAGVCGYFSVNAGGRCLKSKLYYPTTISGTDTGGKHRSGTAKLKILKEPGFLENLSTSTQISLLYQHSGNSRFFAVKKVRNYQIM